MHICDTVSVRPYETLTYIGRGLFRYFNMKRRARIRIWINHVRAAFQQSDGTRFGARPRRFVHAGHIHQLVSQAHSRLGTSERIDVHVVSHALAAQLRHNRPGQRIDKREQFVRWHVANACRYMHQGMKAQAKA
jgi:hypothetical protein